MIWIWCQRICLSVCNKFPRLSPDWQNRIGWNFFGSYYYYAIVVITLAKYNLSLAKSTWPIVLTSWFTTPFEYWKKKGICKKACIGKNIHVPLLVQHYQSDFEVFCRIWNLKSALFIHSFDISSDFLSAIIMSMFSILLCFSVYIDWPFFILIFFISISL